MYRLSSTKTYSDLESSLNSCYISHFKTAQVFSYLFTWLTQARECGTIIILCHIYTKTLGLEGKGTRHYFLDRSVRMCSINSKQKGNPKGFTLNRYLNIYFCNKWHLLRL